MSPSQVRYQWLFKKKIIKFFKIIKGSDYGLKTFGFSLSGGKDLDGNKYPDLIVGAYKSNAVAYLRTKSVIKTKILTQINPRVIDFDSKEHYCDTNNSKLW